MFHEFIELLALGKLPGVQKNQTIYLLLKLRISIALWKAGRVKLHETTIICLFSLIGRVG